MTPLLAALTAACWLALVTSYFWHRRVLQVAVERHPRNGEVDRYRMR